MNADGKQRRVYIRNAVLSFGCTAVCIGVDIRSFIRVGHFYMNWKMGVSFALYIVLILLGIRAVKKAGELKNREK